MLLEVKSDIHTRGKTFDVLRLHFSDEFVEVPREEFYHDDGACLAEC